MIGTTARVLFGSLIGAAMFIAVVVALFTDLFAPETRPTLPRLRPMRKRAAMKSLMEAGT